MYSKINFHFTDWTATSLIANHESGTSDWTPSSNSSLSQQPCFWQDPPMHGPAARNNVNDLSVYPFSVPNAYGNTWLHQAIGCKQEQLALGLMDVMTNVNGANNAQQTPLHIAAERSMHRCILKLLRAGADATSLDCDGNTALHIMVERGDEVAVQTAAQATNNFRALCELDDANGHHVIHVAAIYGAVNIIKILHAAGVNFFRMSNQGKTPFELVYTSHIVSIPARQFMMEILRQAVGAKLWAECLIANGYNAAELPPLWGDDRAVIKTIKDCLEHEGQHQYVM